MGKSLDDLINAFNDEGFKGLFSKLFSKQEFTLNENFFSSYNKAIKSANFNLEEFLKNNSSGIDSLDDWVRTLDGAAITQEQFATKTKEITAANQGLITSTTAAKTAVVAMQAAFSVLIMAAISAYQNYKQGMEEARRASIDAATSANENSRELIAAVANYQSLAKVTNRSAEQEDKFSDAVEGAVDALGNKKEALSGLTEGTEEYTKALQKATEEELRNNLTTAKQGLHDAQQELEEAAKGNLFTDSSIEIGIGSFDKKNGAAFDEIKDIMSSFEVNKGRTGTIGNRSDGLFWDADHDDMQSMINYYYALIEARDKLTESSENYDFDIMDSSTYNNINKAINIMSEYVDSYEQMQYSTLAAQYAVDHGVPETTKEFEAMYDSMKAAPELSEKAKEGLDDYLNTNFSDFIADMGNAEQRMEGIQEASVKLQKAGLSFTDTQEFLKGISDEDLDIILNIDVDKAANEAKEKLHKELEGYNVGNVDLTVRPVVSSDRMQKKGWDVPEGDVATTLTQGEFFWQGDEENGKYVYVHFTPILPDGRVLTPDELNDYLYNCLDGADNILDADTLGIVLKVDDIDASEAEIKDLQLSGKYSENVNKILTEANKWDDKIHQVQEAFYLESTKITRSGLQSIIDAQKELLKPDLFKSLTSLDVNSYISNIDSLKGALVTLNSGDYDASGLLTSLKAINDTVTEMGGSLNWEFIADQSNSLELLGDSLGYIAEQYTSRVFEELKIDNEDLAQAFANVVQESLKAEMQLESFNNQVDSMQSAYSTLTDAVKTYNENGYVTFDQLQGILSLSSEYLSCLVDENGQLSLNYDSLVAMANMRLNDAESAAIQKAIVELNQLAMKDEQSAVETNAQAHEDAVDSLSKYGDELVNNIAKSSVLTSAINELNAALSGAEANPNVTPDDVDTVLDGLNATFELIGKEREKIANSFAGIMGGSGGASKKAGKKEADEYLKAFEEELKKLDALHSDGFISEVEYLERLRTLYISYFRDKKKYAEEYAKYERKYLKGMKEMYESVFSYISGLHDKQIKLKEKEKDTAVDSLKAQQDAAEKASKAQLDAIEAQIKGMEKEKDAIQDEIDAIKSANDERDRSITLQKRLSDLARQQQQRTILQYKDGQMKYVLDTTGIRDAKEEIRKTESEQRIAELEKQKDAIDKNIDALNEHKDAIEATMNATKEMFDTQIKALEDYYDSLIKTMEENKTRWDELAELPERAKMDVILKNLGYTEEQVLSMSADAFEGLKNQFLGVLKSINSGNDDLLQSLGKFSEIDMDNVVGHLEATASKFADIQPVMDATKSNLEDISKVPMDDVSTSTGTIATNLGNAAESSSTTSTNLQAIGSPDTAKNIGDMGQAVEDLNTQLQTLEDLLHKVDFSTLLPKDQDNLSEYYSTLADALSILDDALKEQADLIEKTYVPTWQRLHDELNAIILGGSSGGSTGEKESSAKTDNSEGSTDSSGIVGLIQSGGNDVSTALKDIWLKGFTDFAFDGEPSIQSTIERIIELVTKMKDEIVTACTEAASALSNVSSKLDGEGGGTDFPTFTPHSEGTVGNAFASGYPGLPTNEKKALRSEFGQPELTVFPNGTYELTTKPTISDLPKDSVIFNEEQTKQIINNSGKKGHSFASGTFGNYIPLKDFDPERYSSYQRFSAKVQDLDSTAALLDNVNKQMLNSVKNIEQVNNHVDSSTQTVTQNINVTLPNVNDSTAATKLLQDLQTLSTKKYQFFNKR